MSAGLLFSVFLVLIVLAGFFWFWSVGPRDQVPPHLNEQELRRLEVQDRIRQTNYQVLTALGLGATFLTTLFQFVISSQHWTTEFENKANQERTAQFIEAVHQLDQVSSRPGGGAATSVAGIRTLYLLGIQRPFEYHGQAHDLLSAYIRSKTHKETQEDSQVCLNEEALPDVQVAMSSLGHNKFSRLRMHDEGKGCSGAPQLELPRVTLDSLDLRGVDLSCASMSRSKFRRVNFKGANLASADLSGARLVAADHCWVTDLSGANLARANFQDAALAGANLSHADLTGANLCRTDISGANLTGVKGLNPEMLRHACVGNDTVGAEAQPIGLNASFSPIRRCSPDSSPYSCASNEASSGTERNFRADTASVLSVAIAWAIFWLVGVFAKSKLQVKIKNSSAEIPSRFPERSVTYSSEFLKAFVRDHPSIAQTYRFPILFPLDLIVMVLLSSTMAAASWHWFAASGYRWPMLAVILPLLYFMADLAEDLQLRRLLNSPDAVTKDTVAALKRLTTVKLVAIVAVIVQTLAALSLYIWFAGFRSP
jgi:uncharacterized protein YjbI with pentapeptide repeats